MTAEPITECAGYVAVDARGRPAMGLGCVALVHEDRAAAASAAASYNACGQVAPLGPWRVARARLVVTEVLNGNATGDTP